MGTTDTPTADFLGFLKSDMMAMNAAAALAYRDMPMPNRTITDDDEVPGGEDQGEICKPINQTNEE